MILDTDEEILGKVNRHIDAIKSLEKELPCTISDLAARSNTEIAKLDFFVHYFDSNIVELYCAVVDFHNLSESYEKVLGGLKNLIETKGAYTAFNVL